MSQRLSGEIGNYLRRNWQHAEHVPMAVTFSKEVGDPEEIAFFLSQPKPLVFILTPVLAVEMSFLSLHLGMTSVSLQDQGRFLLLCQEPGQEGRRRGGWGSPGLTPPPRDPALLSAAPAQQVYPSPTLLCIWVDSPRGCPSPATLVSVSRVGNENQMVHEVLLGCLLALAHCWLGGEGTGEGLGQGSLPAASHPGPLQDFGRDVQAPRSAPAVIWGHKELSTIGGRGEAGTSSCPHPVLVPHRLPSASFVHSWFCEKLPEKELYLSLLIYHLTWGRMPQVPRHLSPHRDPINPHSNHMAINQL
ncbi:uncharacterized protein LOC113486414 [Athene cunicularia]|uniref:uncharacterized protein LOC113486414 n=1 Tax=Athene cunicularia TaxID=194338 RepID=UPI000EF72E19|nr:uncharacterized protein LOC113486414 [Athene cunicularia]